MQRGVSIGRALHERIGTTAAVALVRASAARVAGAELSEREGTWRRSYGQQRRQVARAGGAQRVYLETIGFVADRQLPSLRQPKDWLKNKFKNVLGWWYMKKPQPKFTFRQLSGDAQRLFDDFNRARASADLRGLKATCSPDLFAKLSASMAKLPPNVRVEWTAKHSSRPKMCTFRYIKLQSMPMELCQATVRTNTLQTVRVVKGKGEQEEVLKEKEAKSSDVLVLETVTNNPGKGLQWKVLDVFSEFDDSNNGIGYLEAKSVPGAQ